MSDAPHVLRGGTGDPLLVLIHGIGANAEVWRPMLATAERHWRGRWIAPDLRGHGRSTKTGPFDARQHAADVARLIAAEGGDGCTIVGHSFGGVVAALVGSGAFGVTPARIVAFSVKVDWAENDLGRMRSLADRPLQIFATRDEAMARTLAFAGLKDAAGDTAAVAAAGIEAIEAGFRIALTPEIFRAVDPGIAEQIRTCRAPLRLGSGEYDMMSPVAPMRALDPDAVTFMGAGHNVQWEQPEAVWRFVTAD